jgi:hypothetical protein
MFKIEQEICDITQRKEELTVKLADLDSLQFVLQELEDKIGNLKDEQEL